MLCLRYGHNRSEAEDIFQEGLMNVFEDLDTFQPKRANFKTWSSKILVHAAIKYLKKHQWQRSFQALETAREPLEETVDRVEVLDAEEIVQLIQQLPIGIWV